MHKIGQLKIGKISDFLRYFCRIEQQFLHLNATLKDFFPFYVWPARPCVQLDTTLLAPTVDQK